MNMAIRIMMMKDADDNDGRVLREDLGIICYADSIGSCAVKMFVRNKIGERQYIFYF